MRRILAALALVVTPALAGDKPPKFVEECNATALMQMNAPADAKVVKTTYHTAPATGQRTATVCWQDKNERGGPLHQVVICWEGGVPTFMTDVNDSAFVREATWSAGCH